MRLERRKEGERSGLAPSTVNSTGSRLKMAPIASGYKCRIPHDVSVRDRRVQRLAAALPCGNRTKMSGSAATCTGPSLHAWLGHAFRRDIGLRSEAHQRPGRSLWRDTLPRSQRWQHRGRLHMPSACDHPRDSSDIALVDAASSSPKSLAATYNGPRPTPSRHSYQSVSTVLTPKRLSPSLAPLRRGAANSGRAGKEGHHHDLWKSRIIRHQQGHRPPDA